MRNGFATHIDELNARIRSRLSRFEVVALGFALGFLAIATYYHSVGWLVPHDYINYIRGVHGDYREFYYSFWLLPPLTVLDALPGVMGLFIWNFFNIVSVFFASRVFGGRFAIAVTTYQLLYIIVYGQFTGLIVGGLALFWWGMAGRRWEIAGLGILIASVKHYVGIPLCLTLWLLADINWRDRLRVLGLPIIVGLLTIVLYGCWPLQIVDSALNQPPIESASISLWRWVGPAALILWLPVLLLPLPRDKRLIAIASTIALTWPYFQQAELILLFVLPIGLLSLLGNLGYIFLVSKWTGLQILVVIPICTLLWALYPALRQKLLPDSALSDSDLLSPGDNSSPTLQSHD